MKTGINYRSDYETNDPLMFTQNLNNFKTNGMDEISIVLYWGVYESSNGNYVASEYSKLRNLLLAAASAGLRVHLDFHTLFPQSTSGWATPTNLGGNTTLILSGAPKTQFLNWVTHTLQQTIDLPIYSIGGLNEPSRYTLNSTTKAQTVQLWLDVRAIVKNLRPDVLYGVRFDLTGLKQFTVAQTLDGMDIAFVNEYLDSRDPNDTEWGSTWNDLGNYVNNAKQRGLEVEITEWNGYDDNPIFTADYISNHLAKVQGMGFDTALYWGWKPSSSWEWNLCTGNKVTSKVPLSVFDLGAPPTEPGVLEVHSYLDDIETTGSVAISGVGTYPTPATVEVVAGTYSLTCTLAGQVKPTSAVVQASHTTLVEFRFTTPIFPPITSMILPLAIMGGILYTGTSKKRGRR